MLGTRRKEDRERIGSLNSRVFAVVDRRGGARATGIEEAVFHGIEGYIRGVEFRKRRRRRCPVIFYFVWIEGRWLRGLISNWRIERMKMIKRSF